MMNVNAGLPLPAAMGAGGVGGPAAPAGRVSRCSKITNGIVQIAQNSSVSAVAWGARIAVQQATSRLLLKLYNDVYHNGQEPPSPMTTEGAVQHMAANTIAAYVTTQYVGVAHAAVENVCNAVKRAVNCLSRCCGGDNLLQGAQNNTQFVRDQKEALPHGWGLTAGARAGIGQVYEIQAPVVATEDVFAMNPLASVALTFGVGLAVQGAPFYASAVRDEAVTLPKVPASNLVNNIWERAHATFSAENNQRGYLTLGMWQGLLSTTLKALSDAGASAEIRAAVALIGTASIHSDRIRQFMTEKKSNETKGLTAAGHPDGRIDKAVQTLAFAIVAVSLLEATRSNPFAPSDADNRISDEQYDHAGYIGAGASVAITALRAVAEKLVEKAGYGRMDNDSKKAALMDDLTGAASAVAATYAGGPLAGLAAAAAGPLLDLCLSAYQAIRAAPRAAPAGPAAAQPAAAAVGDAHQEPDDLANEDHDDDEIPPPPPEPDVAANDVYNANLDHSKHSLPAPPEQRDQHPVPDPSGQRYVVGPRPALGRESVPARHVHYANARPAYNAPDRWERDDEIPPPPFNPVRLAPRGVQNSNVRPAYDPRSASAGLGGPPDDDKAIPPRPLDGRSPYMAAPPNHEINERPKLTRPQQISAAISEAAKVGTLLRLNFKGVNVPLHIIEYNPSNQTVACWTRNKNPHMEEFRVRDDRKAGDTRYIYNVPISLIDMSDARERRDR